MSSKFIIEEQANYTLEAVENAKSKAENQVNKYLLPRIREIVIGIAKGDYNTYELRRIMMSTPEGSGPDNDIFMMDVQGGGLSKTLQNWLDELIELVEKYLENKGGE